MSQAEAPEIRGGYRYFVSITTRGMDNDLYGHVNNVRRACAMSTWAGGPCATVSEFSEKGKTLRRLRAILCTCSLIEAA